MKNHRNAYIIHEGTANFNAYFCHFYKYIVRNKNFLKKERSDAPLFWFLWIDSLALHNRLDDKQRGKHQRNGDR